jgi:hypothetical protein
MDTLLWIAVINRMIKPFNHNNFLSQEEINRIAVILAFHWHQSMATEPDPDAMQKFVTATVPFTRMREAQSK